MAECRTSTTTRTHALMTLPARSALDLSLAPCASANVFISNSFFFCSDARSAAAHSMFDQNIMIKLSQRYYKWNCNRQRLFAQRLWGRNKNRISEASALARTHCKVRTCHDPNNWGNGCAGLRVPGSARMCVCARHHLLEEFTASANEENKLKNAHEAVQHAVVVINMKSIN